MIPQTALQAIHDACTAAGLSAVWGADAGYSPPVGFHAQISQGVSTPATGFAEGSLMYDSFLTVAVSDAIPPAPGSVETEARLSDKARDVIGRVLGSDALREATSGVVLSSATWEYTEGRRIVYLDFRVTADISPA